MEHQSQSVESGAAFVRAYEANARHLEAHGLYRPEDEHDACGVGFVAAIDGKPRRSVVDAAINALKAVWHRGPVDADGKTGDVAGGQVFLPRTDRDAQERCRSIVETEILKFGYTIYGWRQVPVDVSVIGEKANATGPEIEQIVIANERGVPEQRFEIDLFIIRRRIEKAALAAHIADLYICSMSCRSVIYKGMFLAEQLSAFYPDLLDERFVSNFAIYHQRYSTNTFPTWRLAQPFRVLAHNGEINTLKGNINWMKSHEARLAHDLFGPYLEDLKPVIQAGGSDSMAADNVFELLIAAGRSLPMVKTLMIPEAWNEAALMPRTHKDMYSYSNAVMEPWDGPAAIAAYGSNWVIAGMDRNGLRPMRCTLTAGGPI